MVIRLSAPCTVYNGEIVQTVLRQGIFAHIIWYEFQAECVRCHGVNRPPESVSTYQLRFINGLVTGIAGPLDIAERVRQQLFIVDVVRTSDGVHGLTIHVDTACPAGFLGVGALNGRDRGHEDTTNTFSSIYSSEGCNQRFHSSGSRKGREGNVHGTIVNAAVQCIPDSPSAFQNRQGNFVRDCSDGTVRTGQGRTANDVIVRRTDIHGIFCDLERLRDCVCKRDIISGVDVFPQHHTGMHLKVTHIGLEPVNFIVDFGTVRGHKIDLPNESIKPLIAIGLILEHDVVTVVHIIRNSRDSQREQFTVRGNLVVYTLVCGILIGMFCETFKEPLLTAGVLEITYIRVRIVARNIL